jgi:hypothetical protein
MVVVSPCPGSFGYAGFRFLEDQRNIPWNGFWNKAERMRKDAVFVETGGGSGGQGQDDDPPGHQGW